MVSAGVSSLVARPMYTGRYVMRICAQIAWACHDTREGRGSAWRMANTVERAQNAFFRSRSRPR